ncbi:phosphotransferase family protein [Bacillaceae bacterium W0354]
MNLGTPIAEGNTAKIYLFNQKIYKVFHEHFSQDEAFYEAHKQKLIYSHGLPIPNVLDVTKVDGKPTIVMEYVNGETLGDLAFKDESNIENYLKLSIKVQRDIHKIVPTGLETMSEKLSRKINHAKLLSEVQKSALLEKLNSMDYKPRLCHGDLHLYNIICTSENKIMIIDWVDCTAGDIKADVCRTFLLYSQHFKEVANLYLSLYCEESGLSKNDILQWEPILAGARLAENVSSEDNERLLEIVNRIM